MHIKWVSPNTEAKYLVILGRGDRKGRRWVDGLKTFES
jgi:hypothetical protein